MRSMKQWSSTYQSLRVWEISGSNPGQVISERSLFAYFCSSFQAHSYLWHREHDFIPGFQDACTKTVITLLSINPLPYSPRRGWSTPRKCFGPNLVCHLQKPTIRCSGKPSLPFCSWLTITSCSTHIPMTGRNQLYHSLLIWNWFKSKPLNLGTSQSYSVTLKESSNKNKKKIKMDSNRMRSIHLYI